MPGGLLNGCQDTTNRWLPVHSAGFSKILSPLLKDRFGFFTKKFTFAKN
jgi:hypothetical protein